MLEDLKQQVCQANKDLETHSLVTLTWGNVSGFDEDSGLVAIKPSGVPYRQLKPEQIVIVDLDGKVVEGDLIPSSDTPTHVLFYKHFEGIYGVTHTHSFYATMFAQARKEIPCLGTTHADHFYGPVPVTRALTEQEVEEAYEAHTGHVVIDLFKSRNINPIECPAVLLGGHAPFTWGKSPAESVKNAVALEAVAQMAMGCYQLANTGLINGEQTGEQTGEQPGQQPPTLEEHVLNKHYQRKHGPNAYYGQKFDY